MNGTADLACLCADSGFFRYAYVLATEIARHADGQYQVVLFTEPNPFLADVPEHGEVTVRIADMKGRLPANAPMHQFGLFSYARLFLAGMLPDDCRRVVYLDSDAWVTGSLAPLFDLDLEGAPVAAVEDLVIAVPQGTKNPRRFDERRVRLGLELNQRYFNAGMIVFDPAVWRGMDTAGRAVEIIRTESHRFTGQDQDALNLLFQDRWLPLSHRWNFMPGSFGLGLEEAIEPAMYHFAGKGKPWDGPSWMHGDHFTAWFAEAFARSPWPDTLTIGNSARGRLKRAERATRDVLGAFVPKIRRARDERRLRAAERRRALAAHLLADIEAGALADVRQGLVHYDLDRLRALADHRGGA